MVRLMLNNYSKEERDALAEYLELAQRDLEIQNQCAGNAKAHCRDCKMRHLCTALLTASVYAKDFVPPVH